MSDDEKQSQCQPHKHPPALKLLVVVLDRSETSKLEEFLRLKSGLFHFMINASGTAGNEVLMSLGLSGSEKIICACIIRPGDSQRLMTSVVDSFSLAKPGNGIVYTLPVSGISAVITKLLSGEDNERNQVPMIDLDKNAKTEYSLVASVINQGYS